MGKSSSGGSNNIKSDYKLTVELRNRIAGRLIEAQANVIYWRGVIKQAKTNSPEIMQAIESVTLNTENIKKDKVFVKCIDEMLKGGIKK